MSDFTKLSRRAETMPASPIRRLAPYAVEARRRGVTVHPLNIGQPDIPTPLAILERFKHYPGKFVPYGPSQGLPEYIEALRHYYAGVGAQLATEDIFVTTAGSEAIQFTMAALCDPGDQVLVFEPFYTNYNGFAAMASVECVPVTMRGEDGYHLPARAAIEAKIGPRTKAILICSPNNPTGTVYTDAEIEMLAAICRDRGLFLVADEVYREFTYDGKTSRSVLTLDRALDPLVVVVDSVSKRYSLCGARIGNIVSRNRAFMDAILRFGQARLCWSSSRAPRSPRCTRRTRRASSPSTRSGATSSTARFRPCRACACASPRAPSTSAPACRWTTPTRSRLSCCRSTRSTARP